MVGGGKRAIFLEVKNPHIALFLKRGVNGFLFIGDEWGNLLKHLV
jgi:hypothetical protein